jgi:hypothetical protein
MIHSIPERMETGEIKTFDDAGSEASNVLNKSPLKALVAVPRAAPGENMS